MKRLLVLAILLSPMNAIAAKMVSVRGSNYLPVFGIGSTSSVSYTGTQGTTVYFVPSNGAPTELVRIFTTTAAFVDIAANPSPSEASMLLPANTEMILEIPSGYRIAAEDKASGAGLLYVTRLVTYPTND